MGTQLPLPYRDTAPHFFGQCPLWPNGWMDEDTTWQGSRSRLRPHCVRRGPSSPPRERGTAAPSFRPMSIVATVAHLSYCWALDNMENKSSFCCLDFTLSSPLSSLASRQFPSFLSSLPSFPSLCKLIYGTGCIGSSLVVPDSVWQKKTYFSKILGWNIAYGNNFEYLCDYESCRCKMVKCFVTHRSYAWTTHFLMDSEEKISIHSLLGEQCTVPRRLLLKPWLHV